ncbi:hypothetical protein R3P38DRAFT_3211677 [Favolaschia claudopus]|uniref:Uncharacterized protein n=1 Tax=Favolaschia claudopus TaxID=2862362 RepID=A0AAW0AG47_9AGAR
MLLLLSSSSPRLHHHHLDSASSPRRHPSHLLESNNSSSAASAPMIQATSTHWFHLAFGVGSFLHHRRLNYITQPRYVLNERTTLAALELNIHLRHSTDSLPRSAAKRLDTTPKVFLNAPWPPAGNHHVLKLKAKAPSLSVSTLPPSSVTAQVLNVRVVCGRMAANWTEAAGRLTHVLKLKAACLVSLTIDILGIPRAPRSLHATYRRPASETRTGV